MTYPVQTHSRIRLLPARVSETPDSTFTFYLECTNDESVRTSVFENITTDGKSCGTFGGVETRAETMSI